MARGCLSCLLKFCLCLLFLIDPGETEGQAADDGYPPLWNLVPQSLEDFATQDNQTVVNPWNYLQRMGMYKMLLSATAESRTMVGPDNLGNVLWGLALQHGWQFKTGRLADPSTGSHCGYQTGDYLCISVRSWWACMNYYLAVIPFLGALDAGFFADWPFEIDILPPDEHSEDFCYTVEDCHSSISKVMGKWKRFFEYLKTTGHKSHSNVAPTLLLEEDKTLYYMWTAHVSSIGAALPKCKERLQYLSAPEVSFGVNWANAVEFIAATQFPTNFSQTNQFQTSLPRRMLTERDYAPFIPDFSAEENRALQVLDWMYKGNYFTGGRLLTLWRWAMCTKSGTEKGRTLLQNMLTNRKLVLQGMFALLMELGKECTR